jgi:hypothetical protein
VAAKSWEERKKYCTMEQAFVDLGRMRGEKAFQEEQSPLGVACGRGRRPG